MNETTTKKDYETGTYFPTKDKKVNIKDFELSADLKHLMKLLMTEAVKELKEDIENQLFAIKIEKLKSDLLSSRINILKGNIETDPKLTESCNLILIKKSDFDRIFKEASQ